MTSNKAKETLLKYNFVIARKVKPSKSQAG